MTPSVHKYDNTHVAGPLTASGTFVLVVRQDMSKSSGSGIGGSIRKGLAWMKHVLKPLVWVGENVHSNN